MKISFRFVCSSLLVASPFFASCRSSNPSQDEALGKAMAMVTDVPADTACIEIRQLCAIGLGTHRQRDQ
jgi:alpha-D-ribose 1-methylphosphonate 5-triphosphate diphosphatase PhnM